jgi:hypothetical protein
MIQPLGPSLGIPNELDDEPESQGWGVALISCLNRGASRGQSRFVFC